MPVRLKVNWKDGSSPDNELEVEIVTNMDDIDHDRIYTCT